MVTAKRLNKKLAPKYISSFSIEPESFAEAKKAGRNKSNHELADVTDAMSSRIQEERASQQINVFGPQNFQKRAFGANKNKAKQKTVQESLHI